MDARAATSALFFVSSCFLAVACSSSADDSTPSTPKKNTGGSGGVATSGGAPGVSGSTTSGGSPGTTAGTSSSGASMGGTGGGSTDSCAPLPDDCTASAAAGLLPFADFSTDPGFYLFANTADATGMTMPKAGVNVTPEEISCPAGGLCAGGVTYAMHVSGGGFTTYGPSLGKDNVYPSTAMPGMFEGTPQDVSMYTGVQFWARKGTATSNPQIGITLNDDTSAPAAALCDAKAATGAMSKACFDGFFAKVSATSVWKLYKVPFAMLKQQGFGNKSADGMFHPGKLYGVSFSLPTQTFDLWIGNIAFYK